MIGQSGTSVDVEAVTVGMTVLALDLEVDTHADLADVRGGVVIAIDRAPDPDTGELQTVFTTAKQWRREVRFSHLTAEQIRDVLPYSSSTVRGLIRAMARRVAEAKGPVVSSDLQLIDAMAILKKVA